MTGRDEDTPKAVKRLKRWPIALKCRIVEETFVAGASVAVVARRNNANANQVFAWRKQYRQGTLVNKKAARGALPDHDLLRIGVIDHEGGIRPLPVLPPPENGKMMVPPESRSPGIIEIELVSGIRVRVDTGIDEVALRMVLAVIREST